MSRARSQQNMTPGGKTTRPRRRNRVRNTYTSPVAGFVVSRPTTPMMTPGAPGRATFRATFQVLSDTSFGTIGMNATSGFPQWAPKVAALLSSFKFFRVQNAVVTYMVTGGAASPYFIIGNVSADPLSTDNTVVAILDDDYAGVANGVEKLVLSPPSSYWRGGLGNWLSADADPVGPTNNAGVFTFVGGGGATPTTVVGWCSIDIVIEFHTM